MGLVFLSEHGRAAPITQILIQGWTEVSPTNNCKPASCKDLTCPQNTQNISSLRVDLRFT